MKKSQLKLFIPQTFYPRYLEDEQTSSSETSGDLCLSVSDARAEDRIVVSYPVAQGILGPHGYSKGNVA